MYIIVSFGLVYLTENFNYWGLLMVFVPLLVGFNFGINHFEQLEKKDENYRQETTLNSTVAVG